jgi:hypothetical protein
MVVLKKTGGLPDWVFKELFSHAQSEYHGETRGKRAPPGKVQSGRCSSNDHRRGQENNQCTRASLEYVIFAHNSNTAYWCTADGGFISGFSISSVDRHSPKISPYDATLMRLSSVDLKHFVMKDISPSNTTSVNMYVPPWPI